MYGDCLTGYSVCQMQRHLDEAFRWITTDGQWRYVKKLLGQTTLSWDIDHFLWTCGRDNKVCCGLGTDVTEVVSKAAVLLEAGKLWNRLLQFHRARQCFRAVRAMLEKVHTSTSGVPESLTEIDIIICQIHTTIYLGQADAAAVLDLPPKSTAVHGEECLLCQRNFRLKGALIALASFYKESVVLVDASRLLQEPFIQSMSCGVYDAFQQHTLTALTASVWAQVVHWRQEDADLAYSTAVDRWHDLGWPLDHTDMILQTLIYWESYCLARKERSVIESALENRIAPVTGRAFAILCDLYSRLWRFLGQKMHIVIRLYYLAETAMDMCSYNDVLSYCHQALKMVRDDSMCDHVETPVWEGSVLYLLGLAYSRTKEMSEAMSCYKQAIPPLVTSSHNLSLMKQYEELIMPNLAGCHEELAEILLDHFGSSLESLRYRRQCLEYADYIDEAVVLRAQALVADALHHQTAVLEQQGRLEEASQTASEAEELFEKTVQGASDSAFEYIVYGYFLFRRQKFLEAERAMHQACMNSAQMNSTVIFYHHELAILTEELQFEVQHSELKRFTMPGIVVALYFRILCLIQLGSGQREVGALVEEMSDVVLTFDYKYCADSLDANMSHLKYGAFALLGYIYRSQCQYENSVDAFRKAYESYRNEAARLNIEQDEKSNLED